MQTGSAKKANPKFDQFKSSNNPLQHEVPGQNERAATSTTWGNSFGINVARVDNKKKSEKKTRELLGSNPIAHTYVEPFKMPANGRMKS